MNTEDQNFENYLKPDQRRGVMWQNLDTQKIINALWYSRCVEGYMTTFFKIKTFYNLPQFFSLSCFQMYFLKQI